MHALAKPHFYHPNPTASNFALKSSQNHDSISTILESFAGSLTFLAFPKADSSPKILESYIDSQNHKTRHNRNFFSKSTASDFALESTFSHNAPFLSSRADLSAWQSIQKTAQLLESTFDKSTISLSSQANPLLSSRDFRKEVVAIHKSAQADSSNAADFTTAKKVDSSLEAMDCHAIATALARNDKKNAASKKVDSSKQAKNVSKQPQDSRICDEKPLLCKPRKEIRLAVYRRGAAQRSKVYRAKPTPKPKPQRLAL